RMDRPRRCSTVWVDTTDGKHTLPVRASLPRPRRRAGQEVLAQLALHGARGARLRGPLGEEQLRAGLARRQAADRALAERRADRRLPADARNQRQWLRAGVRLWRRGW